MNTSTDEPLGIAVLKAALVSIVSALPVFLYLYLEEPRFRWLVDSWVQERAYQLRLRRWRLRWLSLPGWRQEIVNTWEAPPADLQWGTIPTWWGLTIAAELPPEG